MPGPGIEPPTSGMPSGCANHYTTAHLRGVEPSISTLGFVGRILAEQVMCRMCQYQVSTILTFMAAILQNGGHSMNNVIYFDNYEGCNHNSDLLLYILKLVN